MAMRFRHGSWHAYYRSPEDGRQRMVSLHTADPDDAEELHRMTMEAVREERKAIRIMRKHPQLAKFVIGERNEAPAAAPIIRHQKDSLRLDQMWDIAVSKKPLAHSNELIWNRFLNEIDYKFADQITPKVAQDYLNATYGGNKKRTYNNARSALNTVFRCCLVESRLDDSPFAKVVPKTVDDTTHHRNLTDAEFRKLFNGTKNNKALQILCMLSRWTCQRLETCARITPEMIRQDRMVFVIDPGKTRRFGKWVCVPIMPPLMEYLAPLLPKCRPGIPIVFNFGGEKSNANYSKMASEAFEALKIRGTAEGSASFHSLRGTAITWYKEHNIRGEILRSITGHASASVEDIYARDIATLEKVAKSFRKTS